MIIKLKKLLLKKMFNVQNAMQNKANIFIKFINI